MERFFPRDTNVAQGQQIVEILLCHCALCRTLTTGTVYKRHACPTAVFGHANVRKIHATNSGHRRRAAAQLSVQRQRRTARAASQASSDSWKQHHRAATSTSRSSGLDAAVDRRGQTSKIRRLYESCRTYTSPSGSPWMETDVWLTTRRGSGRCARARWTPTAARREGPRPRRGDRSALVRLAQSHRVGSPNRISSYHRTRSSPRARQTERFPKRRQS